ncbi:MAG TPA: RidA family protein [Verrucomicrobiae bacterium]|nr:RidA family protein [Verrucomicrobiae bacterium]
MTAEDKLNQLNLALPPPPPAVAAYAPWMRTGNLVLTSGQLPWKDGRIAFTGRLGAELTVDQGYQAARQCALNAIAQLKDAVADLEKVAQILKIDGFVHAAPGFRGHPQVMNGASDLFNEVFGSRGRHARLAIGVNEMPLDAAVQICVTAEVTP